MARNRYEREGAGLMPEPGTSPAMGTKNMTTITVEQQQAIRNYFKGRPIPGRIGTPEAACSVAGINLALTGTFTDLPPACMSLALARWMSTVNDEMPGNVRNGEGWRDLLPAAAGTGRQQERERVSLILTWAWNVLATGQPIANRLGFGQSWRLACSSRDEDALRAGMRAIKEARGRYEIPTGRDGDAYVDRQLAYANADDALLYMMRALALLTDPELSKERQYEYASTSAAQAACRASKLSLDYQGIWQWMDPVGTLKALITASRKEEVPCLH